MPASESGRELKLYSSKKDERPVVIEKPVNFFKLVSESKEVSKMHAMISSCMQGIKLEFNMFNQVKWKCVLDTWENNCKMQCLQHSATLH